MVEQSRRRTSGGGEEVEIVELASSKDAIAHLRLPPETPERADPARFRLDPDDTHLVDTSPRAAGQRGAPQPRPAPQATTAGPVPTGGSSSGPSRPLPPATGSGSGLQQLPVIQPRQAQPLVLPTPGVPPAPAGATAAPSRASEDKGTAGRGREDGDPGQFSLQLAQSQYYAFVRSRIYRVNERFMPRGWIEATLTRKVSADFEITLVRGGRLASMRLMRSCGYSTLDDIARQAINTASPFEGWPPEAGDALTFTVTVYYTPYR